MTERATQGERASSCARPADVGARSPECAIRYEGVSFSYKPGVPFMEGLSAAIPAGAVTSIVGPNGCGKSTLVKLASGLLRPAAGRVEVAGFMEGLSAAIPAGAVTSIVGPNGCGKSTLVKLASGLLRPAAGRVEVAGRDTGVLASRERAHLMAVLAQTSRVPPMTVEALVACGRGGPGGLRPQSAFGMGRPPRAGRSGGGGSRYGTGRRRALSQP